MSGPETEAGQRLLADFEYGDEGALADILAIEAEARAAAVAPLEKALQAVKDELRHRRVGRTAAVQDELDEMYFYVVGLSAPSPVREPCAPLEKALREARELLALRPSGHTGSLDDRIPWFIHCGISHGEGAECVVCSWLSAPSPVREPEGLDVERLARALPWVDLPGFGVLEYDPESKTLILTERIGRNEFGAAGIVARDCDSDVMLALLAAARREGWDAALAAVRADAEKWHATQATLDFLDRLAAEGPKP